MEFPTALLGVALGTILLPSLSKAKADGDHRILRPAGLGPAPDLPAGAGAVGMAVLAEPMIATLFHYGAFTTKRRRNRRGR
jgi:putative peptidoglycan lipid II flippase